MRSYVTFWATGGALPTTALSSEKSTGRVSTYSVINGSFVYGRGCGGRSRRASGGTAPGTTIAPIRPRPSSLPMLELNQYWPGPSRLSVTLPREYTGNHIHLLSPLLG